MIRSAEFDDIERALLADVQQSRFATIFIAMSGALHSSSGCDSDSLAMEPDH